LERQRFLQQQNILVRELTHRVGNTLAIVSAVFRQSSQHANSKQELAKQFEEGLSAINSAHSLLSRGEMELNIATWTGYTDASTLFFTRFRELKNIGPGGGALASSHDGADPNCA
jgi:two-component sensor histidine kinase